MTALAVTLAPGASVHIRGRDIHLSDIATVAAQRPSAFDPVVARLPLGQERVVLTRAQIGDLVARVLPGARVMGATRDPVTILSEEASTDESGSCFRLTARKRAGEPISSDSVETTPCDAKESPPAIRFERESGTATASEDLESGTYLGHLRLAPGPAVKRGQKIVIGGATGQVRVQRTVVALQSAVTPTQKLFVRDSDGEVFAAELPSGTPR